MSGRRALLAGTGAGLAAVAGAVPGALAAEIDLALVLAVDASWSVDAPRFDLQQQGYVEAFRHPRVAAAIGSGRFRGIAAAMMQWTGPDQQSLAVPWTRLDDPATILGFSNAIGAAPRRLFRGGTSISGAIDTGMSLLAACPWPAARRVIDISGDGTNNRGRAVSLARDDAVALGVVVNGLPILDLEPDLDQHYRTEVIGGPGAFVIAAEDWQSFAAAILNKLVREIAATDDRDAAHRRAERSDACPIT